MSAAWGSTKYCEYSVPIVQFNSVSKLFTEDSYALMDITFEVEPGELIFITGPSGSGKTTLMRLLTREYTPTEGEIFFKDEPLTDIKASNVHEHRRKIGVVFQDYQLVPEMNVWENIALPLYVSGKKTEEVEQRVTDLLNLIKLPEKADQFPSQLSGGEAQRVSIARALAIGPELIFADEPTGNLDPDTSKAIARLLRKINELGTTILIATHDQEIMKDHTDLRRIKLENGRLIFDSKKKGKVAVEHSSSNAEKKQVVKDPTPKKYPEEVKTETKAKESDDDAPAKEEKKSFFGSLFKKKSEDQDDETPIVVKVSKEDISDEKPKSEKKPILADKPKIEEKSKNKET